ncbi:MAG: hypothetical protein JW755_14285, partial [Candidatus Aminicenantes bacterium]|nr:hypothetical protein [Candidatus Aminicenantes bacterium]
AVALPFFFAGICISLTITHLSGIVGKLYFFDLVGASLGCLTFLVLTEYLKVTDLIILLSGVALVSSFLFFLAQEKRKFPIRARHIAFLVAYLLVIFYSFSTLSLPINPYKECFTFLRYPDTRILYEKENSFSRIKVIESSAVHYAPGLSLNFNGDIPEQMAILTDDSGLSAITRFDGKKESIQFTDYLTNSLGYHLASKKERVFIIGAGGGLDILSAIYHNSQQIEAAELNPIIIDALKNRYADYSGQLFNRPEVRIIQGEGRSILKDIDHKVDLIQISLIGSASTSSGGFYSISENYIYTVEGMMDFLNHLSPDGLICITRWLLFPPRESVKLASIALEALQKVGAKKPENHLALIRSWGTTTLVCSKKPLDGKQNKIIEDFCQR